MIESVMMKNVLIGEEVEGLGRFGVQQQGGKMCLECKKLRESIEENSGFKAPQRCSGGDESLQPRRWQLTNPGVGFICLL